MKEFILLIEHCSHFMITCITIEQKGITFDQGRFQSFRQGSARWRAKRAKNNLAQKS